MSLREILKDEGVDVDELDVELEDDGKVTPEKMQEVQQALIRKQRERIKDQAELNGPEDIGYYDPDSIPVEEDDVFGVDQLIEQFEHLENEGFHTPDTLTKGIKLDETSAYGLYEAVSREFLEFADSEISSKRSGKVELAEAVLEDPEIDFETALRWFEDKDSVSFDEFNEELFHDERNLELGVDEKVYDQTIEQYWNELRAQGLETDDLVKRGVLLDLVKTLEGLAPNRDEGFREQLDSYSDFLTRFRPEIYQEAMEEEADYTVYPVLGERKMTVLSDTMQTCMTRFETGEKSVDTNIYQEAPRMHQDDPFTLSTQSAKATS